MKMNLEHDARKSQAEREAAEAARRQNHRYQQMGFNDKPKMQRESSSKTWMKKMKLRLLYLILFSVGK